MHVQLSDSAGIFFVFSGPKFGPISQWNLGNFFPNGAKKKSQSSKNFFLNIGIFIQSVHTHKQHCDVLLQFNRNSM